MTDFDFMAENEELDETDTSGNPDMEAIKVEARKLAGSSKGLDIEVFQRKHKIHIMHVDELLKD